MDGAAVSPQPTTISNFRDVADLINSSSPPTLKPSLFYRSALPSTASQAAQTNLTTTYHIKTIIDLRSDTEIREQQPPKSQPQPPPSRQDDHNSPPPPTTSHISLNGSSYSRALLKRLTYTQTAKLGILYALSYRTQAISILGTNVMSQRGLSGLAIDTLTHSTAEIAALFNLLAKPATYPVLVHCTQGKDRTGLVVLLVSLLCGACQEGVERDYMRSEKALEPEREERVKEIARIGLPPSFAGCEEGWVGVVSGWLEKEWGGVEGYLRRACGAEGEVVEGVRRVLMVREGE